MGVARTYGKEYTGRSPPLFELVDVSYHANPNRETARCPEGLHDSPSEKLRDARRGGNADRPEALERY